MPDGAVVGWMYKYEVSTTPSRPHGAEIGPTKCLTLTAFSASSLISPVILPLLMPL